MKQLVIKYWNKVINLDGKNGIRIESFQEEDVKCLQN